MHEVLVNRLGGLSLPRKNVVRLTDRPDMTLDVYRGRKTTKQQQQQQIRPFCKRKQKLHLQKILIKFSAWEAKGKQFYEPTLMSTFLHFRGMAAFQTHIIKHRYKLCN